MPTKLQVLSNWSHNNMIVIEVSYEPSDHIMSFHNTRTEDNLFISLYSDEQELRHLNLTPVDARKLADAIHQELAKRQETEEED